MSQNHQGDMMKTLLLLSAVAATSVAATLSAQVVTGKPDSTCTKYPDGRVECKIIRGLRGDSAFRNRVPYRMDSAMAKRAAIGLELRATGTRRDTLGVFVAAVTPKGPAESAGIIEGDRIAAINGIDLRTAAGDVDDSYANGLAAHRLTREVQRLTPGSRVTLRVYSGGRFRDVQVITGRASDVRRLGGGFSFRVPGPDQWMEFNGPGGAMMFEREMPMMRKQIEPLLRKRLENLPKKIQLRTPMRFRTFGPARAPRVFKVEAGELLDLDDDLFDIEYEIEAVPPAVIRELAANAIRDAQFALRQLAADGVA